MIFGQYTTEYLVSQRKNEKKKETNQSVKIPQNMGCSNSSSRRKVTNANIKAQERSQKSIHAFF